MRIIVLECVGFYLKFKYGFGVAVQGALSMLPYAVTPPMNQAIASLS